MISDSSAVDLVFLLAVLIFAVTAFFGIRALIRRKRKALEGELLEKHRNGHSKTGKNGGAKINAPKTP